jgi:hypothetical protein
MPKNKARLKAMRKKSAKHSKRARLARANHVLAKTPKPKRAAVAVRFSVQVYADGARSQHTIRTIGELIDVLTNPEVFGLSTCDLLLMQRTGG